MSFIFYLLILAGGYGYFFFFLRILLLLGYSVNKKTGSIFYNIFHHKGLAIAIAATGFLTDNIGLMLAGALLFAHSSFDRILDYGLKYFDDFKHTHLGWMK